MANGFDSGKRVMSGTWGEVWLDGDYVSEVTAFQAKVAANKEDVPMCGRMMADKKIMSTSGTGSLTLHKISSRMAIKVGEAMSKGLDVRCTVIGALSDPDAYGAERVALYGVSFDDLTLADWSVGQKGSVTCPFTFSSFEYLDRVGV